MRQHTGHGAVVVELVHHVLHKGKIGLAAGGELAVLAKRSSLIKSGLASTWPKRADWRPRLQSAFAMLWPLQRVFILNVELAVMHIVHDHVHAAQVVGGGVALLAVKAAHILHFLGHPQQQ
jgi:hypothetical protein